MIYSVLGMNGNFKIVFLILVGWISLYRWIREFENYVIILIVGWILVVMEEYE